MIETRPKIITHPSSQVVAISSDNDHLSLTCEAIGATSYYWEREDESIPPGATGVRTKTLTIVNLTPEDAGTYQCIVSNNSDMEHSKYAVIAVIG